jgi:hypothetical protein
VLLAGAVAAGLGAEGIVGALAALGTVDGAGTLGCAGTLGVLGAGGVPLAGCDAAGTVLVGAACGFASGVTGLASPKGLGGSTCRVVSAGLSGLAFGSAGLACVTGAGLGAGVPSLGDGFVSAGLGVAGG